jgi:predicted nuclease of predicted toxin-antitoxin system
LKVDENIGRDGVALLRSAGHDVATVREQGLGGANDDTVFAVSTGEERALVTLDRDFGNMVRFPPERSSGVVVLELGGPASLRLLRRRLVDFITLATTHSVDGKLWIVEPGRIRIRPAKET